MKHSLGAGVVCCACKHAMNLPRRPRPPAPGDLALCIRCASLNVVDDHLCFRAPTVDEYLTAAADSDIQAARRAILRVNALARAGKLPRPPAGGRAVPSGGRLRGAQSPEGN